MLAQINYTQSCVYQPRENGIHQFMFTAPSQQAVDMWFEYLDMLYDITPTDSRVLFLMDLRQSGILPMTYLLQRGKRWLKTNPSRHTKRFAILYNADFPLNLAQTFFRLTGISEGQIIRFYSAERCEEAARWLLQGD